MKPARCNACESRDMLVGEARQQTGRVIHPYWCATCGGVSTQQASRAEVAEFRRQHGEPQRVFTATEKRMMRGETVSRPVRGIGPCQVCGSTENVEVHHWAPAHLFGPECDKWPVGHLCQPCHRKWHRIVTPNMGERKGLYREHYDAVKDRRR